MVCDGRVVASESDEWVPNHVDAYDVRFARRTKSGTERSCEVPAGLARHGV